MPIFAIVGRPNVGKSTLFNVITGTRDALVADQPGVTRDRQYGLATIEERSFWVIDTGGIAEMEGDALSNLTEQQVQLAINECDHILFVVDAKAGLMPADQLIMDKLRLHLDKLSLVINKADGLDEATAASEFYQLGVSRLFVIAAAQKRGVVAMFDALLNQFPASDESGLPENTIGVAVLGKPNVGKSTLINRLLGEERVIALDQPGTTRDSIAIPFQKGDQSYQLIDTAGIRRRTKVTDLIEKFSVIKALEAIDKAHVVLLMIDAREGVAEQDFRLINATLARGRALVLLFNKWDGMDEYQKEEFKKQVDLRLQFVSFVRRYTISALHGTHVGEIYRAISEAYEALQIKVSTPEATRLLEKAVATHQPPLVRGRRVKPRYAHVSARHPLTIMVHGKQVNALPASYKRFLENYYRKAYQLVGVPLVVKFKNDENPYIG